MGTINVMRGDEVTIGDIHFVMGENASFSTLDDVLEFYAHSKEVTWKATVYPFMWGIFGGAVERKTYKGRVRIKNEAA